MIEVWFQWTCDGCGTTGKSENPNMKKTDVRAAMQREGWQYVAVPSKDGLDYCPQCVIDGKARKRERLFG